VYFGPPSLTTQLLWDWRKLWSFSF